MKIQDKNTLQSVRKDVNGGKCALKVIAKDCSYYVWHTNDASMVRVYAKLSRCRTRKQFNAVLDDVLGG